MINDLGVGLVELGRHVGLSDGQTNGVGDAGSQGARGHLDAGGLKRFRVSGSL